MALDNYEGDATELLETYGPLSEQFQPPGCASLHFLRYADFLMKFIVIGNIS